jgi:hypothetical protein
VGSLVKLAVVVYLVLHGVPVSGDLDVKGLAAVVFGNLLSQLRLLR